MKHDIRLSNGVLMPQIGFGTWKHDDTAETVAQIENAILVGYRHIDTAAFYRNEYAVGRAARECGIDRADLFITNKVWNTRRGYDSTLFDFDRAMQTMGLDYLDLYLIHWPAGCFVYENWAELNSDTWRAMERLYREGRVHAIGVSNFLPHHLEKLKEQCSVVPMVNQIKFHPGMMQKEAFDYCNANGIRLAAYSPLGKGKVLTAPALSALGGKYGKTPAQICLRWIIQHGVVPIPKSSSVERMRENLELYDFTLTETEMSLLDNIETDDTFLRDPDTIDLK